MCCTRFTENTGRKKSLKFAIWTPSHTTLSGCVFATKTCIDNRKETCYFLHMPSQYGELRPTSSRDPLASLGHPSRFQRGSRLGFVTAATSLNGSQPNFAPCLAICWAGVLGPYIHFGGYCPLTEFCQVQYSLCVQVLRSFVLAALLHGTRAAAWYKE